MASTGLRRLCATAAACLLLPAVTPAKVIVVSPRTPVAVQSDALELAGAVTSPGEAVSGQLNGQPLAVRVNDKGVFLQVVKLAPGLNKLEINGQSFEVRLLQGGEKPSAGAGEHRIHPPVAEGCSECHSLSAVGDLARTADGATLCLNCHDDPRKKEPSPGQVHSPVEEGDCLACHDPHSSRFEKLLSREEGSLCGECHDDVNQPQEGETLHKPLQPGGKCSACHEPHAGSQPTLLRQGLPALCASCHPATLVASKGPVSSHKPYSSGQCGRCHEPHRGPPKLLKKKGAALCRECHPAVQEPGKGALHSPVADGDCSSCHTPHVSAEANLLTAKVQSLCEQCHDPFAGPTVHKPIGTPESCLSCHAPHKGMKKGLLPAEGMAFCVACHPDPRVLAGGKEPASIHGPIQKYDCLGCHDAHAGQKGLLKAALPESCTTCHAVTTGTSGQPLPHLHEPVEEGCSACHTHHASKEKKLLSTGGRALCLECHDDPGKNGKEPWAYPHPPVEKGCDSCHAPHGSTEKAILIRPGGALCAGCHPKHPRHPLKASPATLAGNNIMVALPAMLALGASGELPCSACHASHGASQAKLFTLPRMQLCLECHKR